SKAASASLETIRQQREALKAEIGEALANFKSAQQQLEMSPNGAIASAKLSESSLYQSRLQAMQKLDLELQQQLQLFTEEHPVVQGLIKQRQEEEKALQQEAAKVLGKNQAAPVGSQDLISRGQLGDNGIELAKQLTDAQNTYLSLQAKDKSLAQTEVQLTQESQKYPSLIAQYERLQPEVEVRRSTLQKLLDAKQDLSLEIARGGYNWEVIEAPTEGLQISPIFIKNLLLGGVIGLFLGGIAAFLRESLDDTVRSADQLGERMPLPLLGGLPWLSNTLPSTHFNPLSFNGSNARTALDNLGLFHWPPLREALDLIYGNIQFRNAKQPHQVLMVTSALSGEGKSTLALGLALSAARLDQKVLLIDADLRHSSLHQRLELSNEEGLSTLLMSDMPPTELKTTPQWVYMRWEEEEPLAATRPMRSIPPSDVNMDILTAGPVYGDPVKLLQFERMKEVLDSFRDEYDLIIVDCPPVLGLVDTMQIGYSCDGVVMIARSEKVTHSDLMTAISNMSKFNLIGCVMNGVEQPNRNYGRSYAYK
ncbi:MAG: AAA family ATPase, partial [Thermosynechococcaceae cyanobacterium]